MFFFKVVFDILAHTENEFLSGTTCGTDKKCTSGNQTCKNKKCACDDGFKWDNEDMMCENGALIAKISTIGILTVIIISLVNQ